jgi:hypothetical protein
VADKPEDSTHTGVRQRVRARQRFEAARKLKAREPARAANLLAKAGLRAEATHAEDGLWLAPLERCVVGEDAEVTRLTVEQYLDLVDATGRLIREGKRGAIDPRLAPILQRLELSVEAWLATMLGWRQMLGGSALGRLASRTAEAGRRGVRWIKNRCPLFVAGAAA